MYTFRNVQFTSEDKAKEVLNKMHDRHDKYGYVTLSDLYEFAGVPRSVGDDSYGWFGLGGARVRSANFNGFEVELPNPVDLFHDGKKDDKVKPEAVDHPNHYQSETGMEVIDVIEAFTFDLKGIEAFDTGNVIKYICRWNNKNGLEDLRKAQWYLNHLIKHVEKMKKENE